MSKKPSFLERLTGVLDEEGKVATNVPTSYEVEEETEEKVEEPEPEPEPETKAESKPEPEKKPAAEEEQPKTSAKKVKKISLAEDEDKSDWLPESEGQLTIDVYQTPADIVIKSTIAGINPGELDITITNDMVTIKGKREKDEEISTSDYYYQECYWGAFSRSVILPVDVEAEKAEASMKNGILTIRLPKVEKVKTRKIKVNLD